MSVFKIILFILAGISILFQGFFDIKQLIILIPLTVMMGIFLTSILRLLFRSARAKKFLQLVLRYFLIFWAIPGFFLVIGGIFVIYQNNINPAKLSNVFLENDKGQKVVFVKMSHIGSQKFYQEKHDSLRKLDKEGYIFLAEGVKRGKNPYIQDQFNAMVGFDFSNAHYRNVSKLFGLSEQTSSLYDGISADKIKNVDTSLDFIVKSVKQKGLDNQQNENENKNEKFQTNNTSENNNEIIEKNQERIGVNGSNKNGKEVKGEGTSLNDNQQDEKNIQGQDILLSMKLFGAFETFSPIQKYIVQNILRSLLNFQAKIPEETMMQFVEQSATREQYNLMKTILQERNEPIIQYIINHPEENIAVVYGSMHFDGVLSELKKHDNSWKIVSVEPFIPYSQ